MLIETFIAADKKAVEAYRGCNRCSTWCTCADTLRLTFQWSPSFPPLDWDGPTGVSTLLDK
eukprot:5107240-Pleurochrysis_carterae.AAC.1